MVPPGGKETECTPKRCNRVGPERRLVSGEGGVARGGVGSFQIVLEGCETNPVRVEDDIDSPDGGEKNNQQGCGLGNYPPKTERCSSNDDRRKRDHQNQLQHQSGMASALPKSVEHYGNQAPQQRPDQEYPKGKKLSKDHSQRNKGSQPQRQPDDGQGNGQKKRPDPRFLKLQNHDRP